VSRPAGVISLDPGSARLGLGWILDPELVDTFSVGGIIFSPPQPLVAWKKLLWLRDKVIQHTSSDIVVVVEDYLGSGPRDRESIACLKQVGGFELLALNSGFEVILHMPDQRKKSLSWAYAQLNKSWTTSHDPDDVSALAHAKTAWDRLTEGGR
jgi:hypothetical protein